MKHIVWRTARVTLIVCSLVGGLYWYELSRCSSPEGPWPIFGDYTIRCEWNRGVRGVQVFELGTQREPRNPITRHILRRLARPVAQQAIGPSGFAVATGEIQARAYGDILPCKMARAKGPFSVLLTSPEQKPLPKGVRVAD